VLDKSNTSNEVWADSAYRSAETEAKLKEKGYKSRIHRRAARNRSLSQRQQAANTMRSRVRARVEHVFADQQNAMGGKIVRTIGIARARVKIGMMNLVYNMRRLVQLERMAAARRCGHFQGQCSTSESALLRSKRYNAGKTIRALRARPRTSRGNARPFARCGPDSPLNLAPRLEP